MKRKFRLLFIPAIFWLLITTVLLVMPGPDVPTSSWLDNIPQLDKIVHAGLFGGMTFFFSLPFIQTYKSTKKLLIIIAILSLLYGIMMEYVQKYIAVDRDFDYDDMIADGVGSIIGYFVSLYFKKRLK